MKLTEWELLRNHGHIIQDSNLNEQGHIVLLFFPLCILWVTYLEKRRKNNTQCGGSTKQAGDSELSTAFIEAENTAG